MKTKIEKYLTDRGYATTKFLVFPQKIATHAEAIPGNDSCCIRIEDTDSDEYFGEVGFHIVSKRWSDNAGLTAMYEEWIGDGGRLAPIGINGIMPITPEQAFSAPNEVPAPPPAPPVVPQAIQEIADASPNVHIVQSKPLPVTEEVVVDQIVANDVVVADIVEQQPVEPSSPTIEVIADSVNNAPTEPKEEVYACNSEELLRRQKRLRHLGFVQNAHTYIWEKDEDKFRNAEIQATTPNNWDALDSHWTKEMEEAKKESLADTSTGLNDGNGKEVHLVAKEDIEVKEPVTIIVDTDNNGNALVPAKEPIQKIYTEKELMEMETGVLIKYLTDVMKVEIPKEGRNTNKKLRALILVNQPVPTIIENKQLVEVEKPKTTKEAPAKKAEPLANVVEAPKELVDQLELVDAIIDACEQFKKVHYTISQIESILGDNTIPDAKLRLFISNAVDNSK